MRRKGLLALVAVLMLGGCLPEKDDPLVIKDDDPLKVFMFPASRDQVWTYRRQTVGLLEGEATVSIAVEKANKEMAELRYLEEGEPVAEMLQGVGIRGNATIQLLEGGAVSLTDPLDVRTYFPDGRVTSEEGLTFELIGTERLTTPAGTFACVKYRVHRDPSEDFPMTLEGIQWWGKGAGLVKAVSTVEGFESGTRTTVELVALER